MFRLVPFPVILLAANLKSAFLASKGGMATKRSSRPPSPRGLKSLATHLDLTWDPFILSIHFVDTGGLPVLLQH